MNFIIWISAATMLSLVLTVWMRAIVAALPF